MPLHNMTSVVGKLRAIPKRLLDEVGVAAAAELRVAELPEVQRRTPVETGDLRDSEHVEGPFVEGKTVVVYIKAGGGTVFYAWIVHENLFAKHRVGQAKFLESVMREYSTSLSARIARRVNMQKVANG